MKYTNEVTNRIQFSQFVISNFRPLLGLKIICGPLLGPLSACQGPRPATLVEKNLHLHQYLHQAQARLISTSCLWLAGSVPARKFFTGYFVNSPAPVYTIVSRSTPQESYQSNIWGILQQSFVPRFPCPSQKKSNPTSYRGHRTESRR